MEKELSAAFLECNFLYNMIASLEKSAEQMRPQIKNNIGSGKYQLLQKIDHDTKILREIYDSNRIFILEQYEKQLEVEFELLKNG